MSNFERELKIGFLDQAKQVVFNVEQYFLALKENPNDENSLNKIFAFAHYLKESSQAVGFDKFGEFTNELESLVIKIKNNVLPATPSAVNLLLKINDHVQEMIDSLTSDLDSQLDSSALLAEIQNFVNKLSID